MDEKELQALYNAMSSKFDIGDYNSFKSKMTSTDDRKRFYDAVSSKGADLGDYQTYENRIGGVKKKEPSISNSSAVSTQSPLLSQNSSTNQVQPTVPQTENIATPTQPELPPVEQDPITLARQADEKGKKVKSTGVRNEAGWQEFIPDEESVAESKKINEEIVKKGYDPKKLITDFADYPEDKVSNIPGFSKEELLNDYKDNQQLYERKLATAKWQTTFKDQLRSIESNPDLAPGEAATAYNDLLGRMENVHTGDYAQQRQNLRAIIDNVNKYGGDKKESIIRNLGIDFSNIYGKEAGDVESLMKDETYAKGGINSNQAAAWHYLEDIHPEEKAKYKLAFIKDEDIKDNPEAKIGKQEAQKKLDELGIQLRRTYLNEKFNPIRKEYDALYEKSQKEGLSPEDQTRFAQLEQVGKPIYDQLQQTNEDEHLLVEKYPDASYFDTKNFAQELVGQQSTGIERFLNKTGEAVKNTGAGIYDFATSPFMSKQEDEIRQAEILGQGKVDETISYLKQSNQINKTFKPELSKELQTDVDAIKNDNNLSQSEKLQNVTKLLMSRTGEWQRTPQMKTNLGLKSLMYGISDMAASLVPFMALETLTGGGATAGFARKFTATFVSAAATGFEDSYREGIEKGETNPYAYATRVTAINSAAIAGAQTPEAIRNMFKGQKTAIGNLVSKMTDNEIESALKAAPKSLKTFRNSLNAVKEKSIQAGSAFGSSTVSGVKSAAKINAFMTGGRVANDAISGELRAPEDYAKDFAIETLKFALPSAIIGGVSKTFRPTDMSKAGLYEVATNKDGMLSALDQKLKDGTISQQEGLEVRRNIETASKIYEKNSPVFKTLDDKAKREYIYNAMIESRAKEAATGLPDKQAEKFEMQAEIAKHKNGLLVEPKTSEQLEKRKAQLEKSLIPEKDAEGKNIEVPEKEVFAAKAEIAAIDEVLDEHSASVADSNAKRLLDKKENTVTLDEKGQEVKPTAKSYSEAAIETRRQGELYDHPKEKDKINAKYDAELAALKASEKNVVPLPKSEEGKAAIQEAMSRRKEVEDAGFVFEPDEDHPFPTPDTVSIGNVALDFEKHNKGLGTLGYILLGEEYLKQGKHLVSTTPEYREGQATGVWKKLVKMGLAEETSPGHYKYGGEREAVENKSGTKLSIDKDAVQLLNEARDTGKLGVFKNMEDEAALKMISEQAQNIDATGGKGKPEDAERAMQSTVNQFGKELVDAAIEKYPAKEPVEAGGEEGKTTSIKNAVTKEEREQRKLPEIEIVAKKTFGDVFDTGKKAVDEGTINPKALAKEVAERPRPLKPEESVALLYDRMRLHNEHKDVMSQIEKAVEEGDQYTEAVLRGNLGQIEEDININDIASRKTGYEQGLGLAVRKMMIKEDYSLANQLQRLKVANEGKEIPEEVRQKMEALTIQLEEAQSKLEEYEKKINELQAKNNIPKRKPNTKKSKEDFNKERKDIFKDIKDKWKDAGNDNTLSALPLPYAKQLAKITPDVARLIKSYAEQGITELKDIVADIHANLKIDIPEITEQDVIGLLAGEFKEKKLTSPDKNKMELQAKVEKIKRQIDLEKEKIRLSNRTKGQKGIDWFLKWRRLALLSGVKVLGKIGIAAGMRSGVTSPIESGVGEVLRRIPGLKQIARGAPREGSGFNPRAEAKALAQWVDKMTYKDIKEIMTTGEGQLDHLHKDKLHPAPTWMDFFGQLHSAIKTLPKRAEYFRSFELRAEHAAKEGKDLTDPVVQQEIAAGAYSDALRTIFMNDNYVTDAYKSLIRSMEASKIEGAKSAAFALKFLFPIIKVPTNFVAESTTYMIGGLKAAYALRKGIKDLSPAQKDYIFRALKKQTIGAAFIALGYFNPQAVGGYFTGKRKDDDIGSGTLSLFGVHLPHWMSHTPLLEALQLGATLRRTKDAANKKKAGSGSLFTGLPTALSGTIGQIPFFSQGKQIGSAVESMDGFKSYLFRTGQGVVEPQLIKEVAELTDTNLGEDEKYDPATFLDQLKLGIPGVRQQVPKEKKKGKY